MSDQYQRRLTRQVLKFRRSSRRWPIQWTLRSMFALTALVAALSAFSVAMFGRMDYLIRVRVARGYWRLKDYDLAWLAFLAVVVLLATSWLHASIRRND